MRALRYLVPGYGVGLVLGVGTGLWLGPLVGVLTVWLGGAVLSLAFAWAAVRRAERLSSAEHATWDRDLDAERLEADLRADMDKSRTTARKAS